MSARAAVVRMEVVRNAADSGAPHFLRLTGSGGEIQVPYWLTEGKLREQRMRLRAVLDRVRATVGEDCDVEPAAAVAAFRTLQDYGLRMIGELITDTDTLLAVHRLFQSAYPAWPNAGADPAPPPVLIDVQAMAGELPPIEMLPLFDPVADRPDGSMLSLTRAASAFVGFAAIVRRLLPDVELQGYGALNGVPRLRMKVFQHAELRAVAQEIEFFERRDEIALDTPWPARSGPDNTFVDELTGAVLDPTSSFDPADAGRGAAEIYHFACHCDTSAAATDDYKLALAGRGWFNQNRVATLGQLDLSFRRYDFRMDKRPACRPLIFLNACGSSDVDPAGLSSFPRLFLTYKHRGFIGTETKMPDDVAAVFSRTFYGELLRPAPLGDAIQTARWHLLKTHSNPLGLLYSVYADPDTKIMFE